MRHGYKWWETFWGWFLEQSDRMAEYHCGECMGGSAFKREFKDLKKEFEKLWREGHFNQSSP